MVLVEYDWGKLLWRAALLFVGGLCLMGSLIGAPLGLFLIAHGFRAVARALASDKAAIVQHPRGLEVRKLWRTRSISFDHYVGVRTETIYTSIGIIPIPGPTMLVIESDRGGKFGKRKLRLPIGFLKLTEAGVPQLGEAIELFALPHREAGATWHRVLEERSAGPDFRAPPRALATPAAPRAARRDPLEGALRTDLAGTTAQHFGRKPPVVQETRL